MSEMTTSEACAAAAQFGRFIKGLARLQEVAAALEAADQLIRERQARADQVLTTITEAEAKLEETQAHVTAANEAATSATAAAQTKAAEILAAAREEADGILVTARKSEFHANGKVTGANGKAADAERRLKIAQDDLATVETRLEQAKAEGRKIFGG